MLRSSVTVSAAFLGLSVPALASDTDCGRWLVGFVRWEDMVRRQLVERVDHTDLGPVDANGGFEGVGLNHQGSRQLSPAPTIEFRGEERREHPLQGVTSATACPRRIWARGATGWARPLVVGVAPAPPSDLDDGVLTAFRSAPHDRERLREAHALLRARADTPTSLAPLLAEAEARPRSDLGRRGVAVVPVADPACRYLFLVEGDWRDILERANVLALPSSVFGREIDGVSVASSLSHLPAPAPSRGLPRTSPSDTMPSPTGKPPCRRSRSCFPPPRCS